MDQICGLFVQLQKKESVHHMRGSPSFEQTLNLSGQRWSGSGTCAAARRGNGIGHVARRVAGDSRRG